MGKTPSTQAAAKLVILSVNATVENAITWLRNPIRPSLRRQPVPIASCDVVDMHMLPLLNDGSRMTDDHTVFDYLAALFNQAQSHLMAKWDTLIDCKPARNRRARDLRVKQGCHIVLGVRP
jgi:hypothetical protein